MAQQLVANLLLRMNIRVLRTLLLMASALRPVEKHRGLRIRFIMAHLAWWTLLALLGRAIMAFSGIGLVRFSIRIIYLPVALGTWFLSRARWPTPVLALVVGLVGSRRICSMVLLAESD